MNIIKDLTQAIEKYRETNKSPCKSYATEAAAEKATAKMAKDAAVYFDKNNNPDARSARYLVFYIESWGRWVGAIEISELLHRPNSTGGYLGFCTGFYTF